MKRLIIKLFIWAIIRPHYKAIVKRGLIKSNTCRFEFYDKSKEELDEIYRECFKIKSNLDYEITDLIFVLFNWFYHKNYNIDLFIDNLKTQKERAKNKTNRT